jgi:hypothetical protein
MTSTESGAEQRARGNDGGELEDGGGWEDDAAATVKHIERSMACCIMYASSNAFKSRLGRRRFSTARWSFLSLRLICQDGAARPHIESHSIETAVLTENKIHVKVLIAWRHCMIYPRTAAIILRVTY